MTLGVTGHVEHAETHAEPIGHHPVATSQASLQRPDRLTGRAVDDGMRPIRLEPVDAADVVTVFVGDQDRVRLSRPAQALDHRVVVAGSTTAQPCIPAD